MDAEISQERRELEDEYAVWAKLCSDKHGLPWPISAESVPTASNLQLSLELKKLKTLGRTPHE